MIFNEEEDCYEILTSPEEFDAVNQALADAGVTFASAEVTMIPQTTVDLTSEDDIKKMNRILGLLDEDDDVQNVYHNWNEPEEVRIINHERRFSCKFGMRVVFFIVVNVL